MKTVKRSTKVIFLSLLWWNFTIVQLWYLILLFKDKESAIFVVARQSRYQRIECTYTNVVDRLSNSPTYFIYFVVIFLKVANFSFFPIFFTFFLSYLHFIIYEPSSFSCTYMPNSFFNTFPLFFYAIADRQMTTRPVGQIFMIAWARVKAEIEAVKPQLISSDEIIIIRMKFVVDREIVI